MDYSILFIKVKKTSKENHSYKRMPALVLKNDNKGDEYFDIMEFDLKTDKTELSNSNINESVASNF